MSYDSDYKAAKANGTLLDPMPADYVQVRTLVTDAALPDVLDGLTVGTDAWYDKHFEVYVTDARGADIKARQAQ